MFQTISQLQVIALIHTVNLKPESALAYMALRCSSTSESARNPVPALSPRETQRGKRVPALPARKFQPAAETAAETCEFQQAETCFTRSE